MPVQQGAPQQMLTTTHPEGTLITKNSFMVFNHINTKHLYDQFCQISTLASMFIFLSVKVHRHFTLTIKFNISTNSTRYTSHHQSPCKGLGTEIRM